MHTLKQTEFKHTTTKHTLFQLNQETKKLFKNLIK